jgi:hypothetical protein
VAATRRAEPLLLAAVAARREALPGPWNGEGAWRRRHLPLLEDSFGSAEAMSHSASATACTGSSSTIALDAALAVKRQPNRLTVGADHGALSGLSLAQDLDRLKGGGDAGDQRQVAGLHRAPAYHAL